MATARSNRIRLATSWPLLVTADMEIAFKPYASIIQEFGRFSNWPGIADYNAVFKERIAQVNGGRVELIEFSFVPQQAVSRRQKILQRKQRQKLGITAVEEYVGQVVEGKTIPTRLHNWHDFLNMLTWMIFPQSKAALYQLYYETMKCFPISCSPAQKRPRLNDLLTCFDEGGIILLTKQKYLDTVKKAVKEHDLASKSNLLENGLATALIFGHGLLENIAVGKTAINAMAWVLVQPESEENCTYQNFVNSLDRQLSRCLSALSVSRLPEAGIGSFPVSELFLRHLS